MAGSTQAVARKPRAAWILSLQLGLTLAVLLLAMAPPVRGNALIVPVGGQASPALAGDARLLGAGPLPGSLIVEADRASLLIALWRHGLVAVATSGNTCEGNTE